MAAQQQMEELRHGKKLITTLIFLRKIQKICLISIFCNIFVIKIIVIIIVIIL